VRIKDANLANRRNGHRTIVRHASRQPPLRTSLHALADAHQRQLHISQALAAGRHPEARHFEPRRLYRKPGDDRRREQSDRRARNRVNRAVSVDGPQLLATDEPATRPTWRLLLHSAGRCGSQGADCWMSAAPEATACDRYRRTGSGKPSPLVVGSTLGVTRVLRRRFWRDRGAGASARG
jgi:hypothetical protein